MPKHKSHSGAKKRFKLTGSGKVKRQQANRRHYLEHKSSRLTRRLAAAGPEGEYQTGLDLTAELAQTILAAGAGGMHVYTFNRPDTTTELLDRIGIAPRPTG